MQLKANDTKTGSLAVNSYERRFRTYACRKTPDRFRATYKACRCGGATREGGKAFQNNNGRVRFRRCSPHGKSDDFSDAQRLLLRQSFRLDPCLCAAAHNNALCSSVRSTSTLVPFYGLRREFRFDNASFSKFTKPFFFFSPRFPGFVFFVCLACAARENSILPTVTASERFIFFFVLCVALFLFIGRRTSRNLHENTITSIIF